MGGLSVAFWDVRYAQVTLTRFERHDMTVVSVPATLTSAQAVEEVESLDLTAQELVEFKDAMLKREVCSQCGGVPIAVVGYSHYGTGQRGPDSYCGACLVSLFSLGNFRSLSVHPYPGVGDPRMPDGSRLGYSDW